MNNTDKLIPVPISIMTISDSRTESDDKSGDLLVERINTAGHCLIDRTIVKDDIFEIRAIASQWIFNPEVQVIISTGGTGVTGYDGTPEAIKPLLEKELEGFGEIFRKISYEDIGTSSIQSRALAGLSNGTYIFCLPGSSNACATAWDDILKYQLDIRTRPCNLVELMPRLLENKK